MPSLGGVPRGQIPSETWWLFNGLSAIMSALAIVALARHAFVTWSLSAPMALIMDAYNATMHVLLGWAHPYLQAEFAWIGSFIGWRPTLYPHWRDVFVVIALLGIGTARASLPRYRQGAGYLANIGDAVAHLLGAIIAALAAGLLPLRSSDLATQLLIAASLGLATVPSSTIEGTRFGAERYGTMSSAERFLTVLVRLAVASAGAALVTWLLSLAFGSFAGLGLASIAMCVLLLGTSRIIYWVRVYFDGDVRYPKGHITALSQYKLVVGLTILGGFLGAFCFFAIDAGLKLVMG
jgi:hypothetical protein